MEKKLMEIYQCGIENLISISDNGKIKKENIFRHIKILIFYFLLIIFNKKKDNLPDEVYINRGVNETHLIPFQYNKSSIILRGKAFKSIVEFIENPSFVSMYCRAERIKININIVKEYIKNRKEIKHLSMWIEFCWIVKFIQRSNVKCIASCGHYDEITTWIALLSEIFYFKTVIIQHGFISSKIKLAHKIPCDEVVAFDNKSLNTFKQHIISNENCIYKVEKKPFIQFQNLNRHMGYKYIGIIEQCNKEWVNNIIKVIETLKMKNIIFVILLHPLSSFKYVNEVGDSKIIITRKKISNLDLLIMECSTLAIDYYTAKIDIPILFTSADGVENLSEYPFVYVQSDKILLEMIAGKLGAKL